MPDKKHDEEQLIANDHRLSSSPGDAEVYRERGQILYRLGRYDEALTAYDEALKHNPELVEALRARGQLCYERGDLTQALAHWESLFKLQQADEDVYLGKYHVLRMLKNIRDAQICYQEAILKFPYQRTFYMQLAINAQPSPHSLLACEQVLFLCTRAGQQTATTSLYCDKGQALSLLKRYPEALQAYEQALSLAPHDPDIHVLKAHTLKDTGHESEALEVFERALKLYEQRAFQYPHKPLDLIQKAWLLCSLGRFQEALSTSEQALQLDSGSARAWFVKGEALFQLQQFAEALAAYKQTVTLVPAYERVDTAFGYSLGVLLRYENNLADCEQRLHATPEDPQFLIERANHLLKLKRHAQALEISEQVLLAHSNIPEAYLAQGTALYALKRYSDAALAYQQTIKLRPAWTSKSMDGYDVDARLEYIQEAAHYNAILQQQPDDWKSGLKLAELQWRFGHYEDARSTYLHASRAAGDDLEALLEVASHWPYGKTVSLQCCERALLLSTTDARVYARQGMLLYDLGYYNEGLAASEQALRLDPQNWLAMDTRKKIVTFIEDRERAFGNLTNPMVESIRQGGTAWNAWRASQSSPVHDLRYLALDDLDLHQIDLSRIDLSHSSLNECNLTGATLHAARLEEARLDRANLSAADARQIAGHGLSLMGANLSGTNLRGADLSHASLKEIWSFHPNRAIHKRVLSEATVSEVTDLCEAHLNAADLFRALLDYVLMVNTNLREANLVRSLLRSANLHSADLSHANLMGASLAGADLSGALLFGADLTYADLRGTRLDGADLRGATLFETRLENASLHGVDLTQTIKNPPEMRKMKDLLPPLFPFEHTMVPPSVSTAEMRPGILTALFRCQAPGCNTTMKLELVAESISHEDDQYQALRTGADKPASIICDYLPGYTTAGHPSGMDYDRLELALRQGDVAALSALNRAYAPFYCWRCHGVYCYDHMRFQEIWDDYYPHPDYWIGTCPYGHPQFVDH